MAIMKKFRQFFGLTLVLTVAASNTALVQPVLASDYAQHWAKAHIDNLISRGIVTPVGDNNTYPDNFLTRAEMAVLVNKSLGLSTRGDISRFSDVSSNDWFANDIAIAVGSGILAGDSSGKMRPRDNITRQEASAVIARALSIPGDEASANKFIDSSSIASWAKGSVGALANKAIISGYPNGSFLPLANIKRGEMFAVIDKATQNSDTDIIIPDVIVDNNEVVKVGENQKYGSDSEVKTVKSVTVTGKGATLSNLVITGDLVIDESVGSGEVTLEGVTVQGKVYVNSPAYSLHIKDSSKSAANINTLVVSKPNTNIQVESGKVSNILAEARSYITTAKAAAVDTISVKTPDSVVITGSAQNVDVASANANVTFVDSTINKLHVLAEAKNAQINLSSNSRILSAIFDAVATVKGTGTINEATLNVANVTFDNSPLKVLGQYPAIIASNSGGGGSSGGGSGGSGGGGDVTNLTYIDAANYTATVSHFADLTFVVIAEKTSLSKVTVNGVPATKQNVLLPGGRTEWRAAIDGTIYANYLSIITE